MNPSLQISRAALFLLFGVGCYAQADQTDVWHWQNPSPFGNTINRCCFGSGKFVAVGEGGIIHSSTDGAVWDDGRRVTFSTLNSVIYANSQFLAVGNDGVILTSQDGSQWVSQFSGTTNDLLGATFAIGQFVVCGRAGTLVSSTNSVSWSFTSEGTSDLGWITYGNGVFVLPDENLALAVKTSTDAKTWTPSLGFPVQGNAWPHKLFGVEFGNGRFVACAQTEKNSAPAFFYYYSTNGMNWSEGAKIADVPASPDLSVILTFANGLFHVSGLNFFSTTPSGTTALASVPPLDSLDSFRCLAFGAGRYELMAGLGQVWSSVTGTNWTPEHRGVRTPVYQIVRGSNYVAVAGSQPILVSSDGVNFAAANSPTGILSTLAFDGSNYVAGGVSGGVIGGFIGEIYSSSNSVDWVRRTSNANKALLSICRGASRWVAVGVNGTVTTSPSTLAWTLRPSGTANNLNSVAFGGGNYVAVGNGGTIISSADGAVWDVQFSGTTVNLNGVQFLNGQFYAVGDNGTMLSSVDGTAWANLSTGTVRALRSIAYGNGRYLACGYDNQYINFHETYLISTNGIDWQEIDQKIPYSGHPRSVAYYDGSFWITGGSSSFTGDGGAILRSDSADGLPRLVGRVLAENAGFQLRVALNAPSNYLFQVSTNLGSGGWQNIAYISNSVSPFTWTDSNVANSPARYYRTAPSP